MFNLVHRNNLVYNTCWEDPRLDREALRLGPEDRVLVITSAGCNALDYALTGPAHVYAVDMNPRQNALLELKLAGIRRLDFETFWEMFGLGRLATVGDIYTRLLRQELSTASQVFWDRWIKFFHGRRRSFYYRGTSGLFAHAVGVYFQRLAKVRPVIDRLLEIDSLEQQREIYYSELRERMWSRPLRFAMRRDTTLALLGVPQAQRYQIDSQYEGGVLKFVQDCLDAVLGELPISENYFWRVYATGRYSRDCCPEYLKPENFQRLKDGLADRISTHTTSVEGFLASNNVRISRFVLLDHMDWLSTHRFGLLESEWQAILSRSAPGARAIWRSGGLRTKFVDRARVVAGGQSRRLGELL